MSFYNQKNRKYMTMKVFKLLPVLFASLAFPQSTRFVYQVSMKPDAANKADIKTEQANLDVTPQGSVFYSAKAIQRDSIMQRMRQTRTFDRNQMQDLRTAINYVVEKDYPKQDITLKNRIGRDQYAYTESKPFQWKILNETAKIGEYNTQKAETQYGGRTWYAWFTTEVPFQDGPYKFSGLPGLIVKAEDSNNDYSFDLMQTKKIAEPYALQNRGGQVITLKKADYQKMEKRFQDDPASFFSNNSGGGGFGGNNGRRINTDPQRMKQMQDRFKEEQKKNNNPIELN
ncbi:GLPGLI family protein [Elizabethkingia sp. HX WYD]|nr:GLPGLI family protein [Elizabethkingia meningoseptica]MDX8575349.1 GLPGLI family protein [Elizabethkingia sp. HX WYD]